MKQDAAPFRIDAVQRELDRVSEPAEIIALEAKIDAIEQYMRNAGLYTTEQIRPVNEARMLARWKLGAALARIERHQGQRTSETESPKFFKSLLKQWHLDSRIATEAQRIGAMPEAELRATLAKARETDDLITFARLIETAKPWWYKLRRQARHHVIASKASARQAPDIIGPFPLLYADPPWIFDTFHPSGHESHRMPEDHYPTMSDEEIINFKVSGRRVSQIVHDDAALFLWCTSSNIRRALAVMDAWGFTYKTHAVWDKMRIGLGLIFRNQHEVLLYGDRGKMPKPMKIPPSVFRYKAKRHSAKPPEIRAVIGKMYPLLGATSRLELFARGEVKGWTTYGNEA